MESETKFDLDDFQILILEDSPSAMMDLVSKIPKTFSQSNVHKTRNYAEAMKVIKTVDIHVALLDLSMPDRNGMDLIMDLKADEKTRNLPIIVITSVDTNSVLLKALEGLILGYLIKPVDPQELNYLLTKANY